MSAVSETIVREYFEQHAFLVRQQRKYIAQAKHEDDDIDFFVLNPRPQKPPGELPFVLTSADLAAMSAQLLSSKAGTPKRSAPRGWPARRKFSGSSGPKVFQQAARSFGENGAPLKILVVPALPHEIKARDESIALLRVRGVDAVIPFRTMLTDLVTQTETNRNYQKSDLLQTIRILKNYDFFREPQLELFKSKRRKR